MDFDLKAIEKTHFYIYNSLCRQFSPKIYIKMLVYFMCPQPCYLYNLVFLTHAIHFIYFLLKSVV